MKREQGRRLRPFSRIEVTEFASVLLVLVFIVLMTSDLRIIDGVSLYLPRVDNPPELPDADKEDAVFITITRKGSVFFTATEWILKSFTPGSENACGSG
jgi:biopolymer transport protein ExbD